MASFADGRVQATVMGSAPPVWIFHSLLADTGSCLPLARAMSDRFTVTLPGLAHVPQLQATEQFLAAIMPFVTDGSRI